MHLPRSCGLSYRAASLLGKANPYSSKYKMQLQVNGAFDRSEKQPATHVTVGVARKVLQFIGPFHE